MAALAHMASFTRSNLQIVAGEIPNDLSMLKATFFLSGQICFRWGSITTFGILAKIKTVCRSNWNCPDELDPCHFLPDGLKQHFRWVNPHVCWFCQVNVILLLVKLHGFQAVQSCQSLLFPIGSMYGIYANIWGILMVNVTIYSIHGSYGFG